jgi:hypothetical protein
MRNRVYAGLERVQITRAVRGELLLGQIQAAIAHQSFWRRPWQRYEPLSGFLDPASSVTLRHIPLNAFGGWMPGPCALWTVH